MEEFGCALKNAPQKGVSRGRRDILLTINIRLP